MVKLRNIISNAIDVLIYFKIFFQLTPDIRLKILCPPVLVIAFERNPLPQRHHMKIHVAISSLVPKI